MRLGRKRGFLQRFLCGKFQASAKSRNGLFERSADGSGSVLTNKWTDDKGDHYFGWVKKTGWEYVFPKDATAQPMRLVYVQLTIDKQGEVTKPSSPVGATCPLVASK